MCETYTSFTIEINKIKSYLLELNEEMNSLEFRDQDWIRDQVHKMLLLVSRTPSLPQSPSPYKIKFPFLDRIFSE